MAPPYPRSRLVEGTWQFFNKLALLQFLSSPKFANLSLEAGSPENHTQLHIADDTFDVCASVVIKR